jgi:transmembrane sensor
MTRSSSIEARAADWIAREDAGNWSLADGEALHRWLEADIAHRVAYLRLRAAWERADRLCVLRAPSDTLAHTRLARRKGRVAALVACLACVAIAALLALRLFSGGSVQILSTPVGGEERVVLSDGSNVTLNTDTSVRAEVTRTRRLVILEKGEAFFVVRHDPSVPFVVIAGDRRITDLGTRFSVRLARGVVKVVVEEGSVRIDAIARPAPLTPKVRLASAVALATVVDRGAVALASNGSILVVHQGEVQVERDLTWRDGILSFNQTTLTEAADEFNRYNVKKLVVDKTAASIRIDGAFNSDNVVSFAHLLKDGFGLKVKDTGNEIKISGSGAYRIVKRPSS